MPGIKNLDADWNDPTLFSPYMDIQILSFGFTLRTNQTLVAQRKAAGLATWYYDLYSDSAVPPYRWLDKSLACSRVHPWMTYLYNTDGYLRWAANLYRGTDPYLASGGPKGEGGGYPSHPIGENWQFYPGPDGLLGSMRMIAFRDGLTDLTLLKMLAATNPIAANNIMDDIAASDTSYANQPDIYHNARKDLLLVLP